MNSPIDLTGVPLQQQEQPQPRFDPMTGEPLNQQPIHQAAEAATGGGEYWQQQARPPMGAPQPDPGPAQGNPYAPTGWKRKQRVEFDITVPSGQRCRIFRLEREDLFKMNLIQYLDTFTPYLMQDTVSSEEATRRQIQQTVKEDPNALQKMFTAIDQVVMAATVNPKITEDPNMTDYGTPSNWSNPRFVATAYINDIQMEDRMAIFAATFGRSMDELKSVWQQTPGMGSLADVASVQETTQ